jgi:3',5'-cyclic AMP phosphodiesterase CpdA
MTRRIAHISDLHFGRHDQTIVEGLARDLAALAPDLLVVSGDLTQRARRHEFAAARALLDQLALPMLVVPGNHDIPLYNLGRRFIGPLRRYRRYITTVRQPSFCDAELAVVGLDTARALVISGGRINADQLAEVRALFQRLPSDCLRIIVTHHPLMAPPDRPMMPLVGRAEAAAACFAETGVDLVLAGHFHDSFTADLKQQYPGLSRSILVVHAGTATSTRTRAAPNAFNMIEVDGNEIRVGVREWRDGVFAEAASANYRREANGWVRYPAAI